jgi:hypothetical protein
MRESSTSSLKPTKYKPIAKSTVETRVKCLALSCVVVRSDAYPNKDNSAANRAKRAREDIDVCCCTPLIDPSTGQPLAGCGDACLNRCMMVECTAGHCPCGHFCSNQRFAKRLYANVQVEYVSGHDRPPPARCCPLLPAAARCCPLLPAACCAVWMGSDSI